MKLKVFKPAIAICIAILMAGTTSFAQDVIIKPAEPVAPVAEPVITTDVTVDPVSIQEPLISVHPLAMTVRVNNVRLKAELYKIKANLKNLTVSTNVQMKVAMTNLSADIKETAPQIDLAFKDNDDVNYNDDVQDGNDLVKNYSKTYPIDANDKVVIDNRYGNVVVNTWTRNEIKVDVQIKAGAGNSDDAQKVLDNVNISDAKDGNTVSFKTNINEIKNSWMSIFNGNKGNHHIEINYTVYMPVKNELVIDDRYGAITLPDMDGKITINSAYGSLKTGSLPNESAIRVKYGNADISDVGSCAIEVSYGNLNLGDAVKLAANISYSGIRVGKIRETGSINLRYGDGLQIGDLDRGLKSLAINSSYSDIKIGLNGDENADFAVTVHYGDFNYKNNSVTVTEKSPGDNDRGPHLTKSYKGYLGKGNSGGKSIAINSSYGNVRFD